MYITSRTNLVVACMKLYDTFMDDFYDEKYVEQLSDLDVRAQLEVSLLNVILIFNLILPYYLQLLC